MGLVMALIIYSSPYFLAVSSHWQCSCALASSCAFTVNTPIKLQQMLLGRASASTPSCSRVTDRPARKAHWVFLLQMLSRYQRNINLNTNIFHNFYLKYGLTMERLQIIMYWNSHLYLGNLLQVLFFFKNYFYFLNRKFPREISLVTRNYVRGPMKMYS